MARDYAETIQKKYPSLFDHDDFTSPIAVGPGWAQLIDTLCHLIVESTDKDEPPVRALQVKEKFGKLRFYAATGLEYQWGLIQFAKTYSSSVCDVCGDIGGLVCIDEMYATRCNQHKNG